jgi:hypothetical protein
MQDGVGRQRRGGSRCTLGSRSVSILVLSIAAASGCSSTVDMRARGGTSPHAVIPYTGVRDPGARYEDYSVIDASILRGTPKEPR